MDTSPADYHADPCPVPSLSSSIGQILVDRSPAHAYLAHPRLGPDTPQRESSKEMDEGTLVHGLMLGKGMERVQVITATDKDGNTVDNYRTKAAQTERDEIVAAGKTPVLPRELDIVRAMAAKFTAKLERDHGIVLDPANSERAIYWTERAHDGTEIQCRAMLDNVDLDNAVIYDIKRLKSAHPRSVRKYVEGACIQHEAYRRAVIANYPDLAPRMRFQWIVVEPTRPHEILLAHPSGSMEQLGGMKWEQAINRWAWCMKRDRWPGYAARSVPLEASAYALEDAIVDSMDQWGDESEGA